MRTGAAKFAPPSMLRAQRKPALRSLKVTSTVDPRTATWGRTAPAPCDTRMSVVTAGAGALVLLGGALPPVIGAVEIGVLPVDGWELGPGRVGTAAVGAVAEVPVLAPALVDGEADPPEVTEEFVEDGALCEPAAVEAELVVPVGLDCALAEGGSLTYSVSRSVRRAHPAITTEASPTERRPTNDFNPRLRGITPSLRLTPGP